MKSTTLSLILALAFFGAFSSCKKESDTPSKPAQTEFISFKANGQSIDYDSCVYTSTSIFPNPRVGFTRNLNPNSDFVIVTVPLNGGTISSDTSNAKSGYSQISVNQLNVATYNHSSSLTVTTTENTPQRVSGTFQGKLYNDAGTQSITVTEGRFSAKKY